MQTEKHRGALSVMLPGGRGVCVCEGVGGGGGLKH